MWGRIFSPSCSCSLHGVAIKNNNSVDFLNTYITFRWKHPLSLKCHSYCCPSKCEYEMLHMCLLGSAGLSSISIPWLSTSSWFLWAIGDTLDLDWFRTNFDGRTFLSFLAAYLLQSSDQSKPLENTTSKPDRNKKPERRIDSKVEDLRESDKETDIDRPPQHSCTGGTLTSRQFLIQFPKSPIWAAGPFNQ